MKKEDKEVVVITSLLVFVLIVAGMVVVSLPDPYDTKCSFGIDGTMVATYTKSELAQIRPRTYCDLFKFCNETNSEFVYDSHMDCIRIYYNCTELEYYDWVKNADWNDIVKSSILTFKRGYYIDLHFIGI